MQPTGVDAERDWWDSRERWKSDLHGVPPYDPEPVADRILAAIGDRSGLVLDLGCGIGRLSRVIVDRRNDLDIIGLDISPTHIEEATLLAPPHAYYQVCDGRSITVPRALTAAYSVTVFQHLPHYVVRDYIGRVAVRLLPGAPFVFSVAIGDADEFLNHQCLPDDVIEWCDDAGLIGIHMDVCAWTWVTTRKPAQ